MWTATRGIPVAEPFVPGEERVVSTTAQPDGSSTTLTPAAPPPSASDASTPAPAGRGFHGAPLRGLDATPESRLFAGRFGRMFRALRPADYGIDDAASQKALAKLGRAMEADKDDPKDGPDNEEGGFPCAYTYFGQFIDHDLTFDPASSLQRQDDPDALTDYRTPRFDLDNLYGRGPDDQPYLYADGVRFNLGEPLAGNAAGAAIEGARDLPRSAAGVARAIIGDPRNDENVIVSQLQGLMLRLHNRLADLNPTLAFDELQRELRFHYQWVIVNDFLPTIIDAAVLDEVLPHLAAGTDPFTDPPQLRFFAPRDDAFMPLEFSVAAYRFGHSLIRPGYRLNDDVGPLPIFQFANHPSDPALTGFGAFPAQWAIDWNRFINLEDRPYGNPDRPGASGSPGNLLRTQLAYKIDTSLVNPLKALPARVAGDPPPSLAERNLLRGWRMRLPCGQDVARAMGVPVLADDDILIGKFSGDPADMRGPIVDVAGSAFAGNCPLWTYVLAETRETDVVFGTGDGPQTIATRRLGPVGGRIVAETFVGIMLQDSSSWLTLDPRWTPTLPMSGGRFGLRELIAEALS